MNTTTWKWFRYDEIFEIKKGKRLTKADMIEGEIPYIGAIDSNNGVSARIGNDEQLHCGNVITVSYNGSIAEAFYQENIFWATDDVNVLYPKFKLNKYIAMFLISLITREKYRFNYGRKWDKDLMQKSNIKLPATADGSPDWQFMEDYTKNTLIPKLPAKTKAVWQNNFNKTPLSKKILSLNTNEWKWFPLSIFHVERGARITKPDREIGTIPLITAGSTNEGCAEYISNESQKQYSNAITIDMFGFSCYREYTFCCDDNILVLQHENLNHYNGHFIATIINRDNYRCAYGRQYRQKTLAKHKILLPITSDDSPDWQFMENYIKSLPYSACIQ